MKFLVLLFYIGAASALVSDLQYEYEYKGVVATGIPEIQSQVAGTGIKANLKIQMKSPSNAIAQLSNIEVGEYHGIAGDLQAPLPIQFSPMRNQVEQLMKPFAIDFTSDQGKVLTVPQGDVEWMVNIRKTITGILRPSILKSQFESKPNEKTVRSWESLSSDLYVDDETIHGRCKCEYSFTPPQKNFSHHHINVQGRSQIGGHIDKYFKMVRSIDFDNCDDRVLLKFDGVGNSSQAGHSQFNSLQSRSSVSTYTIGLDHVGALWIESVIVEGSVTVRPLGLNSEKLQAITNQTLVLKSVNQIKNPLSLPSPTRPIKTWRFEVTSPYLPPVGQQKPWVNYQSKPDPFAPTPDQAVLLGIPFNQLEISAMKTKIIDNLWEVANETAKVPKAPNVYSLPTAPGNAAGSNAAYRLMESAKLMSYLTIKDVQDLFGYAFKKDFPQRVAIRSYLVDVAAASGASAPFSVLLDYMKSDQISPSRQITLFMTITSNLQSPAVIQKALDYVKSMYMTVKPYMTASAFVNLANYASRVCISPPSVKDSVPNDLLGKSACDPKIILGDFLGFLKQKLKDCKYTWERGIVIQTMSLFGTPHIIPSLVPAIEGSVDKNTRVRRIAIYGLSKSRMPTASKEMISNILMKLIDNESEAADVREAAIATFITWEPSSSWWKRMAKVTWRESSSSVAAFITLTIESIAKSTDPKLIKQAQSAAFALKLAKPMMPSLRYSYNNIFTSYEPKDSMTTTGQVTWLDGMNSIIPRELYASLSNAYGDYPVNLFEVAVSSDGLEKSLLAIMDALLPRPSSSEVVRTSQIRTPDSRERASLMQSLENLIPEILKKEPSGSIYLKALNMYQYLPIDLNMAEHILRFNLKAILPTLIKGYQLNATKFMNAAQVNYFMPTDIGLPLTGSFSMPILQVAETELKLNVSGIQNATFTDLIKSEGIELLSKTNYRLTSKMLTKLSVLSPWANKTIEVALDNVKEINLPFYGNLTIAHGDQIKNMTINLSSTMQKKFPVFYTHNVPYTAVNSFNQTKHGDVKVITVKDNGQALEKTTVEYNGKLTGIKAYTTHSADIAVQNYFGSFVEFMRRPQLFLTQLASPTSKLYQTSFVIDPSQSSIQNISGSATLFHNLKPNNTAVELEEKPKRQLDIIMTDSPSKKLQKLKSQPLYAAAMEFRLVLNGTNTYKNLQSFLAWQHYYVKDVAINNLYAGAATNIPSTDIKPMCFVMEAASSQAQNIEQLKQQLQKGMKTKIWAEVNYGHGCHHPAKGGNNHIVDLQGELHLSEERKALLLEQVEKTCNHDRLNNVTELRTSAIYDKIDLSTMYKSDAVPDVLKNVTYKVQDFLKGIYFPHATFDHLARNTEEKVTLNAQRPLSSDRFTFWVNLPYQNVIIRDVWAPYYLMRLTPLSEIRYPHTSHSEVMYKNMDNEKLCYIDSNSTKTFDKVAIRVEPLSCYTVASFANITDERWQILTRRDRLTKYFYAQLIVKSNIGETTLVIDYDKAILNGKEVKLHRHETLYITNLKGKHIMTVSKFKDEMVAQIINRMKVHVERDQISLTPITIVVGSLRGMCGDYDMRKKYDLSGPDGCLYDSNQAELYQYSWTIADGKGCDKRLVEEMKEKVEEFQKNCTHRPEVVSTGSGLPTYPGPVGVYPVRRNGYDVCISIFPVSYCLKGGFPDKVDYVSVGMRCYRPGYIPIRVTKCIKRGFSLIPPDKNPGDRKHFYHMQKRFTEPVTCK